MKIIIISIFLLLFVGGCSTVNTTVFEFDKEGKVTKKIVTEEKGAFDKITESTKNKTILVWKSGWIAAVSASIATTENPVPSVSLYVGKVDRGYLSLLPNQQNIADIAAVIKACRSYLEVDSSGIKEKKE